jgi:L-asparaginase
MSKLHIVFFPTGGTIDKDYPRTQGGYAFEIGPPAALRILEKLNPAFSYQVETLLQKDSLDLDATDRANLRKACETCGARHIIVTHGTDTLLESAAALAEIPEKVIILTGAMRPERFSNSDASVNLGIAIGAVQCMPPGVYIAMHGQVLPWERCTRDPDTGMFIGK